jgi:GT2 family glycosyltransferase
MPAQLQALAEQDYDADWEVLVVDIGSTDGSANIARGWSDRLPLKVIKAGSRPGISFALNQGCRAASGDLVAICDADDVVGQGWLKALVAAAPAADIVGGPYEYGELNSAVITSWNLPFLGPGPWMTLRYRPFFFLGNVAIWTDVLKRLGGFNEDYGVGANDVEFCWRASLASCRLGFVAGALVHYRYRQNLRGLATQAYRYGRSEPHLYRDFRGHGMPASRSSLALGVLAWLLVIAPLTLVSTGLRGRWVRIGSHRLGRLIGSLHYRVLYV